MGSSPTSGTRENTHKIQDLSRKEDVRLSRRNRRSLKGQHRLIHYQKTQIWHLLRGPGVALWRENARPTVRTCSSEPVAFASSTAACNASPASSEPLFARRSLVGKVPRVSARRPPPTFSLAESRFAKSCARLCPAVVRPSTLPLTSHGSFSDRFRCAQGQQAPHDLGVRSGSDRHQRRDRRPRQGP